ncbi:DEAD/DEAH box helicase [Thiomicrospira microaerophila]|uniref:DEAD/DEAH box helicase n=1 Tax=Thiomicrospira microaerophila TaxID=406020 RepID=UPI000697C27E|nr:DEAD/DEAH box helicase [Thiomicrospira microaerophila]
MPKKIDLPEPTLDRGDLHSYQNDVVEFFKLQPKSAAFLGLGLGKTICALTSIKDVLDAREVEQVLIVAPLRVAKTVWRAEAHRWKHTSKLRIELALGSSEKRLKALNSGAEIIIINQENIPWLINNSGIPWRWDMLVYDESTGIKNPSAIRFKALKRITKYLERVILLTATPLPNGMLDLWSQIYLLDGGERLGRSMTQYKSKYFTPLGYMGGGYQLNAGAKEEIMNKISDVTYTLGSDKLIDLPKRIDIYEPIEISSALLQQYSAIEGRFFHLINKRSSEPEERILIKSCAQKCLQFACGAIYDADGNVHHLHNEKIKRLKDLVDENPGENYLIAYNFRFEINLLLEAFPDAEILTHDPEKIERWNNKEISILIASPASAGMGLNLQFGGSTIIWFGLTWNLTNYLQFNGRLYRQGQKNIVKILHLFIVGTLEEKLLGALQEKAITQNEVLEFLVKLAVAPKKLSFSATQQLTYDESEHNNPSNIIMAITYKNINKIQIEQAMQAAELRYEDDVYSKIMLFLQQHIDRVKIEATESYPNTLFVLATANYEMLLMFLELTKNIIELSVHTKRTTRIGVAIGYYKKDGDEIYGDGIDSAISARDIALPNQVMLDEEIMSFLKTDK